MGQRFEALAQVVHQALAEGDRRQADGVLDRLGRRGAVADHAQPPQAQQRAEGADPVPERRAAQVLNKATESGAPCRDITGLKHFDKIVDIDQSPIGRTPRSNPATYTGLFTPLRELFAATQEARSRGYKPGRFSFNVKGGRCEACQGDGVIKVEMHFLADVYVPCEECKGNRYNRETLEIKFRGKSIAEVLNMTVEEGLAHRARLRLDVRRGALGIGKRVHEPELTLRRPGQSRHRHPCRHNNRRCFHSIPKVHVHVHVQFSFFDLIS